MSIASEITRLQNAKAAIKAAIETKGVVVDIDATLDEYADLIIRIEGVETFKKIIDKSIERIVIPNDVTVLGERLFSNCTNLIDVEIPNSVTTFQSGVFYGCSSITNIVFPPLLTEIPQHTCYNCTSLSSVYIPSGVTKINAQAFMGTHIQSLNIHEGVVSIGAMAFSGSAIITITLPSTITALNNQCFDGCRQLESVYVNAINPPTLGSMVFRNNASGRKIYVPAESVNDYKGATNWSEYANDIEAIPTNS